MFCKFCGNQINDGATFCKYCGANFNPQAAQSPSHQVAAMCLCPSCGKQVTIEALFCKNCGASLAAPAAAPPPSVPPPSQVSVPPPPTLTPPLVKAPEIPDKPIIPVKESPSSKTVATPKTSGSNKTGIIVAAIAGVVIVVLAGLYFFNTGSKNASNDVANSTPSSGNASPSSPAQPSNASNQSSTEVNASYYALTQAYFYSEPDANTVRRAYLAEGDVTQIKRTQNGFGYTDFTNSRGQTSSGWVRMSDMAPNRFTGRWYEQGDPDGINDCNDDMSLEDDGTFVISPGCGPCAMEGRYLVRGNTIVFNGKYIGESDDCGNTYKTTFEVAGNNLRWGSIVFYKN